MKLEPRSPLAPMLSTLGALALVGVVFAVPAASQTAAPESFAGTYRLVGGSSRGEQVIHRAIDEAVEPMSVFVRGIAAGRLRENVRLAQRIDLDLDAPEASVTFDGARRYHSPIGEWQPQRIDGRDVRVQIRQTPGALVQLTRGERGSQRVVYRLRPNGSLSAEFTLQAEQLPRDLRYRLTYRRASGAAQ